MNMGFDRVNAGVVAAVATLAFALLVSTAAGSSPDAAHEDTAAFRRLPGIIVPAKDPDRADQWLWDTPELRPQWTLFDSPARARSPVDWSPDGRSLLLVERSEEGSRMVSVSADTLGSRVVAETPGYISAVRWSPDGERIAYVTLAGSSAGSEFLITSASGDEQLVVARDSVLGLLSSQPWAPNSRRVAAAVAVSKRGPDIVVWQLDDGGARELCRIHGSVWLYDPVWSPDGTRILVRSESRAPVLVDVSTGQPVVKDSDTWQTVSASPDLRYLVGNDADGLAVMEIRSDEMRPVVLANGRVSLDKSDLHNGPVWFSDGSAFAIAHDGRLWVVDPATGDGTAVGPQQVEGYPNLERTGPAGGIAFHQAVQDGASNGLYVLDRPGGEPRLVGGRPTAEGGAGIGHGWEWSPNGKWGLYRIGTPIDSWDSTPGHYHWHLLLDVAKGQLYRLPQEGWTDKARVRRVEWSPTRSQALVWFDYGPSLLDLPQ